MARPCSPHRRRVGGRRGGPRPSASGANHGDNLGTAEIRELLRIVRKSTPCVNQEKTFSELKMNPESPGLTRIPLEKRQGQQPGFIPVPSHRTHPPSDGSRQSCHNGVWLVLGCSYPDLGFFPLFNKRHFTECQSDPGKQLPVCPAAGCAEGRQDGADPAHTLPESEGIWGPRQ